MKEETIMTITGIGSMVFSIILALQVESIVLENMNEKINYYCSFQSNVTKTCISTFTNTEVGCGDCFINGSFCSDTIVKWDNCNITLLND